MDFGELAVLFGELRAEQVCEARIRKALEWVWKNLLEHKVAALLITTATIVIKFGKPNWESSGDTRPAGSCCCWVLVGSDWPREM